MQIKQFIEKAIEGGHYPSSRMQKVLDGNRRMGKTSAKLYFMWNVIFLDPKAWEAVGKVEGWREGDIEDDENPPDYVLQMHQMIDALCEGKTVEEFIKTL